MKFNQLTSLGTDVIKSNFQLLKRPYKYFLVVTKNCNSRCKFCKIWQEKPVNEMNLDEYARLAENSKFLKWLNISGGEPTLRSDLTEIIKVFSERCPDLSMLNFTTNGISPDKIISDVEFISKLNLNKVVINVSLDGTKEVHEKMRGIEGNFDSAIHTFKELRKIKNIESFLAFTMYGPNNSDVFNLLETIKQQIPNVSAADFHLNLPQNSGHYYGNQSVKMPVDENVLKIIDRFESLVHQKLDSLKIAERTYRTYAKDFYATNNMPMTCSAMMSSVYISEVGDVYPCTIWDKKLGSLREVNFDMKKIIETREYANVREEIKKNNCPKCWTPCEAFPTIAANLPKVAKLYM